MYLKNVIKKSIKKIQLVRMENFFLKSYWVSSCSDQKYFFTWKVDLHIIFT